MTVDWTRLEPHRPLDGGDARYAPRLDGGARIAAIVQQGRHTVLVLGPTGIGKSTELFQAAQALRNERTVVVAPVDRWENVRRLDAEGLLLLLGACVLEAADKVLPGAHERVLHTTLASPDRNALRFAARGRAPPRDILQDATALLARHTGKPVCLVVDGLEKLPPAAATTWSALGEVPDEVDLITSVPFFAAFGPGASQPLREDQALVALRPVEVEGDRGAAGRRWLWTLIQRRLSQATAPGSDLSALFALLALAGQEARDDARRRVADRAAELSGGIPRVFLQLVADAQLVARARNPFLTWPEEEDLQTAAQGLTEGFQRTLLPGDADVLRQLQQHPSDGREVPLDQRVRLLAGGALVERTWGTSFRLAPHPLVVPLLG